jgi:uncharacterized protein YneF (UPF0154 family)
MAGKINRQVKTRRPILVNGKWVHQSFDERPKITEERLRLMAMRIGLKSL